MLFLNMNKDVFFQKIKSYTSLSTESEEAWTAILKENTYKKGDFFIQIGQIPKKVAFVCKGLSHNITLLTKVIR